jgi:hydrogenase maturation factor
VTKGPAVEAAAILAYQAEDGLTKKLGRDIVAKAQNLFFEMTVVKDALVAAPYAHAMHDATEGGLLNGVYEVAAASDTGVTLFEEKIFTPEEISAICNYFNIDPLISIGEGTLVITATAENTPKILGDLKQNGIPAWEIGEITLRDRVFIRSNGKQEELAPVDVDPFWAAYFSTLEE